MTELSLHKYYQTVGACFSEVRGMEVVAHFGDPPGEYAALRERAGVLDLSFRGRLALAGADRKRFLHGQVTNSVKDLQVGEGCYAALTDAKAKMQSDLNIYCLAEELLLDFEPGLKTVVAERLEKYIIADDVQVVDRTSEYGLFSVQGPEAARVIESAELGLQLPTQRFTQGNNLPGGAIYCANQPRCAGGGFDLFVPAAGVEIVAEKLTLALKAAKARLCGWQALETIRIEAGLPRYGADIDETNLAPESGIENRAINYNKGCYIGQEVIARIRTYGQVAKKLRSLRLADDLQELPQKGDKLFHGEKEAGYLTSAVFSPACQANLALGYVRREWDRPGEELTLRSGAGESLVRILERPISCSTSIPE